MVRNVPQSTLNKWSDKQLIERKKRLKKEHLKTISNSKLSDKEQGRRRLAIWKEMSKTEQALRYKTNKENKKLGVPPVKKRKLFEKW